MGDVNPMFHMDLSYDWRWYITDAGGKLVCMSTRSFFNYEDARRDYDTAQRQFMANAA